MRRPHVIPWWVERLDAKAVNLNLSDNCPGTRMDAARILETIPEKRQITRNGLRGAAVNDVMVHVSADNVDLWVIWS